MKTMTEGEWGLLRSKLCNCNRYLEFGSGTSTEYAAGKGGGPRYIDVVESDQRWFDELSYENRDVSDAIAFGRLRVYIPWLGPVGSWGAPADTTAKQLWPNYALGVFAIEHVRGADLVLVDGRFRVACILACLLTLAPETAILVHDYIGRDHYHVVEPFAEIVDTVDTMVELRALEGFDREAASVLLKEALYDPR